MADRGNQGPFGEKNFFIPDGHWPYGLSRGRAGCVELGYEVGGLVS